MPRLDLRSDQLAAITDFLASPPPVSAVTTAPIPSSTEHGGIAPVNSAVAATTEPKTRAQRLYRLLCSQCHGVLGNGRGLNARHLFIAPRNHRSPQEMSGLTRESIITAIRSGGGAVGKSTLMPAWGAVLSRSDIELLANYVLTLSTEGAAPKGSQPP